jgi:hypothetical protein
MSTRGGPHCCRSPRVRRRPCASNEYWGIKQPAGLCSFNGSQTICRNAKVFLSGSAAFFGYSGASAARGRLAPRARHASGQSASHARFQPAKSHETQGFPGPRMVEASAEDLLGGSAKAADVRPTLAPAIARVTGLCYSESNVDGRRRSAGTPGAEAGRAARQANCGQNEIALCDGRKCVGQDRPAHESPPSVFRSAGDRGPAPAA